jgi:MFS transporter, DHA1 family, multidrug resistance protein
VNDSAAPVDVSSEAPPTWELVTMVAALMALNALAIDLMLPALGTIANELGVASANDRQLVVVVYILGFGTPQLFYGPISDRVGRRPVIFTALVGYALAGVACALVTSFEALLAMRFAQGVFAAGCRVVALAIVRDVYRGRGMARVMSLVMTIFMVVPIAAPGLGQLILFVAPWEWCFYVLAIAGTLLLFWVYLRLGETLPPERRSTLTVRGTLRAYGAVLRHPVSRGYTIASGVIFAALFAFISSSEQIFREVFHTGDAFALYFAGVAFALSIASFVNSRFVERLGMRRLGHGAVVGFTVAAALLLGVTMVIGEHLAIFFPLFALCFGFFGLIGANFNSLALDPLGHIAGTASAAYGFTTTTLSGVVGGLVGRAFDGSTLPLLRGFVALGILCLALVLLTERGRLFGADEDEG